jgi:hypothetical protein
MDMEIVEFTDQVFPIFKLNQPSIGFNSIIYNAPLSSPPELRYKRKKGREGAIPSDRSRENKIISTWQELGRRTKKDAKIIKRT